MHRNGRVQNDKESQAGSWNTHKVVFVSLFPCFSVLRIAEVVYDQLQTIANT